MSPAVIIRTATAADAEAIAAVRVKTWQAAYQDILPEAYLSAMNPSADEAHWRKSLQAGQPDVLVAEVAGEVIGFAAFSASRDADAPPGTGELWALYVEPRHWSCGVGCALWKGAASALRQQGFGQASLWVLTENQRGIRFYRKAGLTAEEDSRKTFQLGGREVSEIRYSISLLG
jgi:ribosomal protein S18 acetylase RimI-like enzyme